VRDLLVSLVSSFMGYPVPWEFVRTSLVIAVWIPILLAVSVYVTREEEER